MTDIYKLVTADIEMRAQLGMERYGVHLTAGTAKDTLREAYEEALDLVIYLRCELEKRKRP